MVNVEVVYAEVGAQSRIPLEIAVGTTVGEAVLLSGLLAQYPHLVWDELMVGIFGVRCDKTRVCEAGDRIELYRPLLLDPKQKRRVTAKAQRKKRLGLK